MESASSMGSASTDSCFGVARARERRPQLGRHSQPMHGQGFFQSFFQAASRTRIDLLQFTLDLLKATFGLRVADQIVGVRQLSVPVRLLLVGEVLTNVAPSGPASGI